MLRSARPPVTVLFVLLAALLAAASPAAASPGDSRLALGLGASALRIDAINSLGGSLSLSYGRGISEAMAWRIRGDLALYRGEDDAGQTDTGFATQATVGLLYALDVLKYVPYAELGVGAGRISGAGIEGSRLSAVLQVGGGLDVLRDRRWAWGPYLLLNYQPADAGLVLVGIRLRRRWDFF